MFRRLFVVAGLLLAVPAVLGAQARLTGADLTGVVRDQTGGVLPGSTVSVTNIHTNVTRNVTTDTTGGYNVPALPPGTYAVSAALSGFKSQTREPVDLLLGQTVTVDFSLIVATASESVDVAGVHSAVSRNRTEISSVIDQQQIDALPTNGRNFIGFALLAPGVVGDRTPLQGAAATSGLSFTGQRARSNNITVDGLDNNDPFVGAVRSTFSQEAIREFQVLVDSYSAEFGKAAGGVVNIVTRSGTNTLQGLTFLYFRDKSLNARNHFEKYDIFGNDIQTEKPPFRQEQWGATLGGPLRKNRTFYFLSFERTRITDSRFVTIDATAAELLNRLNFPVETGNVPLHAKNAAVFGKIDHHWTTNRMLTVRGNFAEINREGIDEFGGIVARSRGTVQLRTDWAISAAETDVLSNRWINEARVQLANGDQRINSLDPRCGGPCLGVDVGGPSVDLTGVAAVGRQRISPQIRLLRQLQFTDTVSYFKGSHHIKFGAEWNHLQIPSHSNVLPANFGGRYFFSPIPALGVTSALDGLQKGIPAAYVQGYGNPHFPDERYDDLSLFAQDEWKRGRVVFKPGIRYQRQFWQPARFSVSDVGGTTFSFPLASDTNNVAPRVGVSYDLRGKGRTIARGSYGIFYDNSILAVENVGRVFTGAADGLRSLPLPAPLASFAWRAPGHRLSEADAVALLGGSYVSVTVPPDPRLKNPFTHQSSVGVEHDLGSDVVLNVTGIYVRGFNMPGSIDYNPVLPTRLGAGRRPNDVPCATFPTRPCVNGGVPGTSTSIVQFTSFGESWYKAMTVSLSRRLSGNYQFQLSYTLADAQDTSTDYQAGAIVQNSGYGRNPTDKFGLPIGFDPRSERGPASHDQRHRLVLSGLVRDLPWDLQIAGILVAGSGRPFTPLAGADLNGDGNGGQFPPDRARRNPADESTSVGRNSETTASQMTVDLRVSRRFRVGRRGTIDAFFEVFNLFNRANFAEDSTQASSFAIFGTGSFPDNPLPAYGRYTVTLPPRQLQLAVKMGF